MKMHAVFEIPDEALSKLHDIGELSETNEIDVELSYHDNSVSATAVPYADITPESFGIDIADIAKDDIIIFKYPSDISVEDVQFVKVFLQAEFPNNKVIGITSDVDFLIENADEAVAMLQKMIAHIQLIKSTKKEIIL